MRHLASLKRIDSISPIEGADAIDAATVGGWTIVVKKNEHQVGELVVYLEIDSWVPEALAPFLCNPDSPKVYENVPGARLRTKKLRGVVSQGLILPASVLNDIELIEDLDVTEVLGVLKYEPPVAACLAGVARGNFPSMIPKTDQERVQNLKTRDFERYIGLHFEETEKLDGSSCTVYMNAGDEGPVVGVCSRNLDLKETEGNSFWATARARGFIDVLNVVGRNIAIQAELVGPGIQGNKYGLSSLDLYVFDIYDISAARYFSAEERNTFCLEYFLQHSPVVSEAMEFTAEHDRAYFIAKADGKSTLNDSPREGLVYKCVEFPDISFKAISNKWLLKNDSRD